ncbi:MAG: hypothetical protein WB579_04845 [Bryobacteraceae bacterium]
MKLVRHLGAVLFVLGAVSAVPARAQTNCNTASLSGDYSIRITGAIVAGPQAGPVNGVNLTHFDGNGNLTSVDHVIVNGVVPAVEWRAGVGTYTLNPDCTGQAAFTYPDGQSPGLTYFFVLTNYSQISQFGSWRFAQIDIVVSTPAFNITAVGTRKQ